MDDLNGGSFTISNSGIWGSLFGTPIINLPQTAVLGTYGIQDRPVAVNGQVEIRPVGLSNLELNVFMNLMCGTDNVCCVDI